MNSGCAFYRIDKEMSQFVGFHEVYTHEFYIVQHKTAFINVKVHLKEVELGTAEANLQL